MQDLCSTSYYRCIHCLEPNPSLYRSLGRNDDGTHSAGSSNSANNSIQLCQCRRCGAIVDVYCERDDWLVGLDCLLCRPLAYRHVLCNRFVSYSGTNTTNNSVGQKSIDQKNDDKDTASDAFPETPNKNASFTTAAIAASHASFSSILNFFFFSSMLRAHIETVSLPERIAIEKTLEATLQFLQLCAVSLIGSAVQMAVAAMVLFGASSLAVARSSSSHRSKNVAASTQRPSGTPRRRTTIPRIVATDWLHRPRGGEEWTRLLRMLALALVLPPLVGHATTAIVHLWENSPIVRGIDAGLVTLHQWIGVTIVAEIAGMTTTTTTSKHTPPATQTTRPFLAAVVVAWAILAVSLVVRTAILFYCWNFMIPNNSGLSSGPMIPCPGLVWTVRDGFSVCLA